MMLNKMDIANEPGARCSVVRTTPTEYHGVQILRNERTNWQSRVQFPIRSQIRILDLAAISYIVNFRIAYLIIENSLTCQRI